MPQGQSLNFLESLKRRSWTIPLTEMSPQTTTDEERETGKNERARDCFMSLFARSLRKTQFASN